MKKVYNAPSVEVLAFASLSPIGAPNSEWTDDLDKGDAAINSQPWNNGELGWT